MIEAEARALGFDPVRVILFGKDDDRTLQIMAERPETRQLTVEDCAALSRAVSAQLDALEEAGKDPIEGAYRLEVSSPASIARSRVCAISSTGPGMKPACNLSSRSRVPANR